MAKVVPLNREAVRPIIDISKRKANLLRNYHDLDKRANTPYVANMGGGGSGKSHSTAQYLVKRLMQKKHKLLVIRKFATTLNDSVVDLFLSKALPFWGRVEDRDYTFNKSSRKITFRNGSVIIFRGLDNPEKMKSITGITLVWVEEASELSQNEFKIMSDRIRGEPQIYLTYNPISERHWLKARFHDSDDPRITCLFSTYLDNPFVGQKYVEDMEWYKEHDEEHYRIYALGEWGLIRPENPYFTTFKAFMKGVTKYNPHYPVHVTFDFNVKNTALISQHFDGERVEYQRLIQGGGDLEDICRQIAFDYRHNQIYFTGDGSGNNGSAYTSGNQSGWELIKMYMDKYGHDYCDYSRVPRSNPSTASGRQITNALLAHFGKRLIIDRELCGILLDDVERMRALSNGSLDKKDCEKYNYGHAGDCFRYSLYHFEYDTYKSLGIAA
ncbi:PBSX family phage terminase large subunit [Tellurirhabdus bombi]|uniref:PBSX family phage terminase large subunit n=1 Tax=Tellurirhabdus bombi TaxID=2907205 RepID=UPI001F1799AC|nr:PBSX family phage terminase large subunit [Tellurirhabdus bombi]